MSEAPCLFIFQPERPNKANGFLMILKSICSKLGVEITLEKFVSGRQRMFPFDLMQSEEKAAHITDV